MPRVLYPVHEILAVCRAVLATIRITGIRRDIFRILLAKSGFAPDRRKALSEGCNPTICWTASEVSAPLLLIVLCLRASAEYLRNNKNADKYYLRPLHGQAPGFVCDDNLGLTRGIIAPDGKEPSPAARHGALECQNGS